MPKPILTKKCLKRKLFDIVLRYRDNRTIFQS